MPKIGQAMTEGVILVWHRHDGDLVSTGDIIVTIETDKATYDLEAQASGVLHIYVGEGREVMVGTVIAEIGESSHSVSGPVTTPTPSSPPAAAAPAKTSGRKRVLA